MLSLADGIQVDQIAALKPDLIVATNAGLDADTYAKLSAIAPTIAQSGPNAFFEPWKDQATDHRPGGVQDRRDDRARSPASTRSSRPSGKNNPQFTGKKALLLSRHAVPRQRAAPRRRAGAPNS